MDFVKFKTEPEVDEEGKIKVYEIEHFPGKFRDSKNLEYDLRPMETCPSFNNFAKKDKHELQQLLMKAYEQQL